MLLLLVRHAHAGERDPAKYPDDALRPLTRKGKGMHDRISRQLARSGIKPGLILSSPWKRALQTATIMADAFSTRNGPAPVHPTAALAQAPSLAALRKELQAQAEKDVVALVGHEPWMSQLAALLLTGRREGVSIAFPKSGMMGIEVAEAAAGEGMLRFFWRPKMLKDTTD